MDAVPRPSAHAAAPSDRFAPDRRREALDAGLLVAGTVLPLAAFLPWLAAHGFDLPRFVGDLFANRIGAFFGWDVIVSVLTLLALAAVDRELPGRQRLGVALASLLGASVGSPLYLLLRERHRRAP